MHGLSKRVTDSFHARVPAEVDVRFLIWWFQGGAKKKSALILFNIILEYTGYFFSIFYHSCPFVIPIQANKLITTRIIAGWVRTDIGNGHILEYPYYIWLLMTGKSSKQGAQTTLHCCLTDEKVTFFLPAAQRTGQRLMHLYFLSFPSS